MELLFITILGVCIGSFLNVLIIRLPDGTSIVFPPSSCPKCGNKLKIWHNIPIISYIFLRAKCHFCNERISPIYPIVELTTGIIFASLYLKSGIDSDSILLIIIFSLLLTLSVIDLKIKMIPDSLSLLALSLSVWLFDPIDSFQNALLLMGGFTALRFYVSFVLKREAMGEGDIIIAGVMGAVLGIKLAVFAIFVSSILALPFSLLYRWLKSEQELPFVPFLSLALYIVYLFDELSLELLRYVFNG